ncbi:MAG: APC family permease [Actinomycetes bacterium]
MSEQKSTYSQDLDRALSLRENILITLSSVTPASSLFIIVPALIAGLAGGSVLAMALAGLIGIFVGLCYAELSSAYPITGGEYTWAARLLGKTTGFAVFMLTLVSGILIIGVIGSGVAPYLSAVWSGADSKYTILVVILITTVISALTITTNAWVTGVCLALEVLAAAVVAVLGFTHIERGPAVFVQPQALDANGALTSVSLALVVSQLALALFAYNGYGTAVYYSEETKGATRNIGRAIMISLGVTVAVELIPLMGVILGTKSLEGLVGSDAPLNMFLVERGGDTVNKLVSLGVAIAIFNAVIAIQIQNARLIYSSARDKSWPDAIDNALGSINAKTKTPVIATVVVGVLSALTAFYVPFNWLLIATGAGVVFIYAAVAIAALRVRSHGPSRDGIYRMPLFPIPPILVLGFMAYVLYQNVTTDAKPVLVSVVTMAIGALWYAGFIRPSRGARWTLPDPHTD